MYFLKGPFFNPLLETFRRFLKMRSFSGHKVILKEILLPEAYGDSACRARAVDSFWNPDPAVSKIPQLPGGSVSHSFRTGGPGSGRVSLRLFLGTVFEARSR